MGAGDHWITKAEIEKLLAKAKGIPRSTVTHLRRQDTEVCEQGVFQLA
jgi:hypothetical protein